MVPLECHYGHAAMSQGIKLLLDTLDASKGFCVGNSIFVCTMHLGGRNKMIRCANERELIRDKSITARNYVRKHMTSNQI